MKWKNKKFMMSVVIVLLLSIVITTVVFAAPHYNISLEAAFRDIKIYRNGSQVDLELEEGTYEPFIVKGRTYVPLRAITKLFDKDVGWDGDNYVVHIDDKAGQTSEDALELKDQLADSQAKVKELEAKVKDLEAQLKDVKPTFDSLEKDLNKEFAKIEDVKIEAIELSGKESDIEVEIYIDLDDYNKEWKALREKDIEYYIEDVVEYIQKSYEDAKISGFIEDEADKDVLVEFELDSKGKLTFDHDGLSSDLEDLEDYLNKTKKYYLIADKDVEIELAWNREDIEVTIWIDYNDYKSIKDVKTIEDYLKALYDEIQYDFNDIEIFGTFISDDSYEDELLEFEFDSRGNLK